MNRTVKLCLASTLAAGVIGVACTAFAAENDAHVINDATVSLAQAISAAEDEGKVASCAAMVTMCTKKIVSALSVLLEKTNKNCNGSQIQYW